MSIPDFVGHLQSKYHTALARRSLFFTPTTIRHAHSASGIQFEIRCVTSLSAKPTENQHDFHASQKPDDPFAPPYIPDLFVCEFSIDSNDAEQDSYAVLLNKFCIVPRHFLLVTTAFKSQNSPPSPADLYTIRLILEQASTREPQNEWIAFYNSGPESGASQPHKHFQFLPIEKGSSPFGGLIERCAPAREGQIFNVDGLPYSHFIVLVPRTHSSPIESNPEQIEMKLGELFMGLLDSMIDRLRHLPPPSSLPTTNTNSSNNQILSYNFVMTQKYMMLVPRSKEIFQDHQNNNGHLSQISINSLGVGAGMILVKNVESLEALEKIGIDQLLAGVTFPPLKDVTDPCTQG